MNIHLLVEARKAAESRGHKIYPFMPAKKFGKISDFAYSSSCHVCGMGIFVDLNPEPNGIEISGEAVALNCSGRELNKDVSLTVALKNAGYTHTATGGDSHCIYKGETYIGKMNSTECWEMLHDIDEMSHEMDEMEELPPKDVIKGERWLLLQKTKILELQCRMYGMVADNKLSVDMGDAVIYSGADFDEVEKDFHMICHELDK